MARPLRADLPRSAGAPRVCRAPGRQWTPVVVTVQRNSLSGRVPRLRTTTLLLVP